MSECAISKYKTSLKRLAKRTAQQANMEQNCGADSHCDIRIAHTSRYFLIGEMDREYLVSLPLAYGLWSEINIQKSN